MADFLYLFRGVCESQLSPQDMQAIMEKWQAWIAQLSETGNFKSGEPIEASGKQLVGKDRMVVDGPYAEAKDLMNGYLMVTANDLDAAVELAKGCPHLDADGLVEVRPILYL